MLVNGPETIVRTIDTTSRDHRADRAYNHIVGAKPHALRHRLTDTDRATIITAYDAGASVNQLATDWHLGKGGILTILHAGGATIREQRRLTDTEINHATTSYEGGESLASIGQRLGLAHTTIRTALQRRGITRRDTHSRPK
ncbi:helix-turn-helix domain-containing protein [Nocardia abscessus]|uniref:helix-turn-helix domain-containing protein n=1 Tax=Nocardia abscessus TaxID=120957 RepID=UPI001895E0B2|nr:helix-turn-helix domain-containing protein [Nocardia abscessus]MBF6222825.1 helix-turn-helix domain-containing protein [Nocardia abscessus]